MATYSQVVSIFGKVTRSGYEMYTAVIKLKFDFLACIGSGLGYAMSKLRGYLVAIIVFGFAYSVYDNITGGRHRCEKQCHAEGAVDFVWVPESKPLGYKTRNMTVVESRCTCYTAEEKLKKKEEMVGIKDAYSRSLLESQ